MPKLICLLPIYSTNSTPSGCAPRHVIRRRHYQHDGMDAHLDTCADERVHDLAHSDTSLSHFDKATSVLNTDKL